MFVSWWLCGFGALHCFAVWNNLLHQVFVHVTAVHVVWVCLVGLSDWHFVQRGLSVLYLFLFLLFAFSCFVGGIIISISSSHSSVPLSRAFLFFSIFSIRA